MLLLAAMSAVLWGVGNTSMGAAVRRSSPTTTVAIGFSSGLLCALIFSVIQQPTFDTAALLWGCVAGISQGLGWMAFSRSISGVSLAVAAPLAATVTSLGLLLYSAASGHAPTPLAFSGMLVSLAALMIFGSGIRRATDNSKHVSGYLFAGLAGLAFVAQSLSLVQAGTKSSSLVLVGTGSGVVVTVAISALIRPLELNGLKPALRFATFGGAVIFVGDLAFLYALHRGIPALASVVAQLHPLVTAALATLLLRERPTRQQVLGIALAVSGVALIGAGHG